MIFKIPKCPICGALCMRIQRKVKDGYHVVVFCPKIIHEIHKPNCLVMMPFHGSYFSRSKEKARWGARKVAFMLYRKNIGVDDV